MMNETPFFSIVIANYNGEKYLQDAIESILSQSCKDYEIIIVDGASTDSSINIIKKYNDFIYWWVSEEDTGQSNAFNKGFSVARGQYFFWLNSDDLLLPESLHIAKREILKNSGFKWFAANTIFFNQQGSITKCSVGAPWFQSILKKNPIYVQGPTSIFHRDLFEDVGGFDERLHYTMDGDLWYRFYNKGESFHRIDRFFWAFRIHELSKTSHAFTHEPNQKFKAEREFVLSKNKHEVTKFYKAMLFCFKIICGAHLKSIFFTLTKRGDKVVS